MSKKSNKENDFEKKLKHIKKNIDYISERCDKSRIAIFFDMIWCKLKYNISFNEYRIYEFYLIDAEKRKTYLSIFKHNEYSKYLFDNKISNTILNKKLFFKRFKKYINRDIYNYSDFNFKSFEEFAKTNKRILARSNNRSFISSYKVYDVSDFRSPAYLHDRLDKDNLTIIEKEIKQLKKLDEISALVVINLVSIYTDKTDIIASSIKYKENGKIVTGYVDPKKGVIKGNLKNEKGLNVTDKFDKFEIPYYDKLVNLVEKLSKEMEEFVEIEWSFVINNRGSIYLVDANKWEDYVFAQTSEFLNNRIGLYNYYKKLMKKIRDN